MKIPKKVKLAGLTRDRDRHGNVRVYYRAPGSTKKIRLREPEGTDAFLEEYKAARAGTIYEKGERTPPPKKKPAPKNDTMGWLIEQYRASSDYRDLAQSTQAVRNRLLIRLNQKIGAMKYADLRARNVRTWRDAPDAPEAGNALVKTLRQVLEIAVKDELLSTNVAKLVDYRRSKNPDGFPAWTIDDIKAFVKRHPRGSKAYLALCLYLFTAQRRSDVHVMGRQHECDGGTAIRLTQYKNRTKKPVVVEIPIIAPLRDAIDACPATGQLAYIVSEHQACFHSWRATVHVVVVAGAI